MCIRDSYYSGIDAHHITFDSNTFNNIGRTNNVSANHDHGIYSSGANGTVVNNIFYSQNMGWDIQLTDGADTWDISNNTFAFPNVGNGSGGRDGHIVLYGNNSSPIPVANITIRNNIFFNPSNYAIVTNAALPQSGCFINHNILYGAPTMI